MSRGSLSNWIGRAIDFLEPIYEAQLRSVLAHPHSRVEELTPRLWKERFADEPLRSVLDQTPR